MFCPSLLACLSCLVAWGVAFADPITFAVTDSGQRGSLDLGTGNCTPIGDAYADIYAGLGNLPDGTLVAVNYANSTFVRIDSTTGVATPIGPTGITLAVSASLLTGEQF